MDIYGFTCDGAQFFVRGHLFAPRGFDPLSKDNCDESAEGEGQLPVAPVKERLAQLETSLDRQCV